MAGILKELKSTDAILLMYLADELPEQDRTGVQRMLADDPQLRAELEVLQQLHADITGLLNSAETAAAATPDEAAVRRISRAMARHELVLASRPPIVVEQPSTWQQVPRWARGVAAAAAIIIIAIGLWGFGIIPSPADPAVVVENTDEVVEQPVATVSGEELENSFFPPDAISGLDEARIHATELEVIAEEGAVPLL